jgi:xanthine/CO dehydrogenase XdhC/CoxF family maturation factor
LHTDQQQFPDIPALDPSRIRAPVGSIAGSKSKATLAVGVLAEMMGQAKALNLLA